MKNESKILIIDDQPANLEVLEGFLEMEGYLHYTSTRNPVEGIALVDTLLPDLILLDLHMPQMSGIEVLDQLRERYGTERFLPVIILTADITPEAKERALEAGAKDFLTKPFDLTEVGLRIRNLLLTSWLMKEMKEQNQLLEEKVRERTEELEHKNQDLLKANELAEAGNRLKTAFIQNISHEIRTPLNGILGFSELILDPQVPVESKLEFQPLLKQSAYRLINTVTNYMDTSLLATGNMQLHIKVVNLGIHIKKVAEGFRNELKTKGLTLRYDFPDPTLPPPMVRADELALEKVLSHLIDNAIKFTDAGTISIGYTRTGNSFECLISDTGMGIEPDCIEQIFDSFIQGDMSSSRIRDGNGLGLYISREFLELMDGTIHIRSEKGKGTNVYFTLPVAETAGNKPSQSRSATPTATAEPSAILIVEDDYDNRLLLKAILEHEGYIVITAGDGKTAVDFCHAHPEIRLVLMDMRMPEMNGLEATQLIKSAYPHLPICATTAFAAMEDEHMAMKAGCDAFLTKPIRKTQLMEVLQKFIG